MGGPGNQVLHVVLTSYISPSSLAFYLLYLFCSFISLSFSRSQCCSTVIKRSTKITNYWHRLFQDCCQLQLSHANVKKFPFCFSFAKTVRLVVTQIHENVFVVINRRTHTHTRFLCVCFFFSQHTIPHTIWKGEHTFLMFLV